jgi:Uma2 family endonuclease
MTLAVPPPPATRVAYDDFINTPQYETHELVHGVPQEKHLGAKSSLIGGAVLFVLDGFNRGAGRPVQVFQEAACRSDRDDPDHFRRPDVCVVAAARFPNGRVPEGDLRLAPDLAVEVLSPNDVAVQVEQKVQEYLHFGVKIVWIVVPETRTVRIHRADGTGSLLREQDTIGGEAVLEGFTCPVADFFPPGT